MKSNYKARQTHCENCINYSYDEEYDCYNCDINLDEDEVQRFMSYSNYNCPYYRSNDDYEIVKKQA